MCFIGDGDNKDVMNMVVCSCSSFQNTPIWYSKNSNHTSLTETGPPALETGATKNLRAEKQDRSGEAEERLSEKKETLLRFSAWDSVYALENLWLWYPGYWPPSSSRAELGFLKRSCQSGVDVLARFKLKRLL